MLSALLMAAGTMPEPVGQTVFTNTTQVAQAVYSFIVPARVTEIWVVCVGGRANTTDPQFHSYVERDSGAAVLISSADSLSSSIGGGNGGNGVANRAGGGAGGYSGNGGSSPSSGNTAGTSGSGGAGGGGGSGFTGGGHGGGVGLLGEGASGAGGSGGSGGPGGDGSIPPGTDAWGAGVQGSSVNNTHGSNLRYTKTPIAVTPGQMLYVYVSGLRGSTSAPAKSSGAVRIMWGGDRSYPNNAGDLPEVL